MSIYYEAIIPVDGDLYRKHKAVVDACKAVNVPVPEATAKFFDDGGSGECRTVIERGIQINLEYGRHKAVEGDALYADGAVIDLAKLPPGTTKILVTSG